MKQHLSSAFQPINFQCCGWTGPCGSYYDCKTPSAITIRKLWGKKRFITYKAWKSHGTPGASQQGHGGGDEVGEERKWAWGSAFIGVEGRDLGFLGLTLYW